MTDLELICTLGIAAKASGHIPTQILLLMAAERLKELTNNGTMVPVPPHVTG